MSAVPEGLPDERPKDGGAADPEGVLGALRERLFETVRQRAPRVDIEVLARAFDRAQAAHAGQTRSSGEPFLTHSVGTCWNLVDLLEAHLDTPTACAARRGRGSSCGAGASPSPRSGATSPP